MLLSSKFSQCRYQREFRVFLARDYFVFLNMHRAQRTSSKLCFDREILKAHHLHEKKLARMRSDIDNSTPKTTQLQHLTNNKKKEQVLEGAFMDVVASI